MKGRYLQILLMLLCAALLIAALPLSASADTGPKASVRIEFENMGDELCYGTLLSKNPSTGPNSVWDGDEEHIYNYGLDIDIWRAFAEYKDADGFYYLQTGTKVSATKEIAWTYYPPDEFKILLYYPETDCFVVSGIYKRYAFDTYYTVDMAGVDIGSVEYDSEKSSDERIQAYRTYNFAVELGSLAARVIITAAIELLIALFFGFRSGKQILLLLGVNVATQIILNLLLNLAAHTSETPITVLYVIAELAVFVIEASMYCRYMNSLSEKKYANLKYAVYALCANAASFGAGFMLYELVPQIF